MATYKRRSGRAISVADGSTADLRLASLPHIYTPADVSEPDAEPEPVEPPRAGPGSSGDAWRAYAERAGIDLPAEAPRDVIIDAVDQAKG